MRRLETQPTGRERTIDPNEIIVSKTDPAGVITYANEAFAKVPDCTEEELLGASHNVIRHPDTPRCVLEHGFRGSFARASGLINEATERMSEQEQALARGGFGRAERLRTRSNTNQRS